MDVVVQDSEDIHLPEMFSSSSCFSLGGGGGGSEEPGAASASTKSWRVKALQESQCLKQLSKKLEAGPQCWLLVHTALSAKLPSVVARGCLHSRCSGGGSRQLVPGQHQPRCCQYFAARFAQVRATTCGIQVSFHCTADF